MTELWLDDAPGERRAAIIEAGAIAEVHIQRDLHYVLGETGLGHIDRKVPSGAFIVTDDGGEILVRKKVVQPEGTRMAFEIAREAICEPGRAKPSEARLLDEIAAEAGRDQLWQARLNGFGDLPRRNADISAAFDIAIAGASQVGDVTISFQRTKAGLVFDVDGIGDALAINVAAAAEIARVLRLYQIGGMTMIDFVAVDSKDARQQVAEAFDLAAAADSRPFERTAVNGFGLMQLVRARPRPSALDRLFGTRIASPSAETQALWLLRQASRSTGFGLRTITAKADVAGLLTSSGWANFSAHCKQQMGADLVIVADNSVTGYGHVHVAQS